MDYQTEIAKVKELVEKANTILIVSHEHPTFDSMGSSLALYLGLLSLGKKVTVAIPEPVTVEVSGFVGANKVTTDIAKKNFVISLDYVEGSIEKVSYNIEGNKFNLVIEPREGFEPFTADKVSYSQAGGAADLIFSVDTIHLGGLKRLYESEKELYASKPLVNVDRHPNNVHFGQVNLVDSQASSTAEIVGQLLKGLGVTLTEDVATNLLNALYGATNNFTNSTVTATAFELAAASLRAGAKRFRRGPMPTEELPKGETAAPTHSVTEPIEAPEASQVTPSAEPVEGQPASAKASAGKSEAPADWLKPKIFKSSNLL